MLNFFRQILITPRFYFAGSLLILLYVFSFFFEFIYAFANVFAFLLSAIVIVEIVMLYLNNINVMATREIAERLSNGDLNSIYLDVLNKHKFPVNLIIIDEIPEQFQIRDFKMAVKLKAGEEKRLKYELRPLIRGEYIFGCINLLYTTNIGLIGKHVKAGAQQTAIPVYPAYLSMRRFELLAISNRLTEVGIKRVRKLGAQSEFDQIKDYVKGDNYKTINWRATAKKGKLMVNQYQDERSQNVYSIIDLGRTMKMPFNGMTLLDYAINASLIISNTAILKQDKAGLLTFSNGVKTFLSADRKNDTMQKILEMLYRQNTDFKESDYSLLSAHIHKRISQRSLLVLYANFETLTALNRQLKYLKPIARKHFLIVVLFENKEIQNLSEKDASSLESIYTKTIAEQYVFDKKLIVKELLKNGIHSILTKPENVNVDLINKYLELKDTGRF